MPSITNCALTPERRPLLEERMHINLNLHFVFAGIAVLCGVLMLLGGRFSRWPLAAIAIICLSVNELGLFR